MPQRKYSKQRCKVTKVSKPIILPIELSTYNELSREAKDFRAWLDTMIATYPELFPVDIEMGYTLHDILPPSVKLPDVRLRRIRLKAQDQNGCRPVFTIASSDLMPYMTGYTDEWEKPLFLRRFSVPFWGRSYVFGRNDSYWYRLSTHVRRYEIVGTTVKAAGKLPEHLLADEKHARFNGHKAYIATTVGADCVLGASVALNADEAALTEAYSQFKQEAQNIDFDYTPGCLMPASFTAIGTQPNYRSGLGPCFIISGPTAPGRKLAKTTSRPLTNSMVGSIIPTGSTIYLSPPQLSVADPTTENVRTRVFLRS
jgi:hypothetical protein